MIDGDPAPYPKRGCPTQFSAHVYCGQTAAWIKMPLGTEVDLGLRNVVFDVDPATPRKKCRPTPTQFLAHVYCGQMAGWMKTPLGTEVDLGPVDVVLDGVPALVKWAQQPPPLFSTHVYCGHGRPSQLLLSSCCNCLSMSHITDQYKAFCFINVYCIVLMLFCAL